MTKEEAIEELKELLRWYLEEEPMSETVYKREAVSMAISALSENKREMTEQWQELKETITEMRDNDGTGTQQEVCKFLANLMDVLEKQMSDSENQNKCGDLISRQAVLDELEKWDWQDLYLPIHFKQILDDIPSVENKGEWIYQQGIVPYKWRCNKCEKMFKTDFNYCPNCGADMRGET